MSGMPTWWLVISAFAYVCLALVCISLFVTAIFVIKFLKDIAPKVNAIEGQVQDLIKKVQDLTTSVQQTVSELSGKAKGVVGSAEGVAQSASRQFERYSPFVIGSMTAIRLVGALNGIRKNKALGQGGPKSGPFMRRKPKTLIGKVIQFVRR